MKYKHITITGGKGFLGKHLVAEFRKRGCQNIAVADLPEYNLVSLADIQKMYEEQKPDIVIHLAAKVGGIGFNQENPASLFYENAMMGIQLIHEGYLRKIEKFVALGTICAYPKFTPVPFLEDDLWNGYPEETNAPYGLAKKMMLVQSQAYRKQYGFNSIFLLPVNLYGPGDNFTFKSSHVIPALIRKFHLANLLTTGDYAGIINDFHFNKETEVIIEDRNVVIQRDSSPETIHRVLIHFGIYPSTGERAVLNSDLHKAQSTIQIPQSELRIPGTPQSAIRNPQSNVSQLRTPNFESSNPVVEIWGTGKATREFFYVADAASAIALAAENYDKSEPVNLGAGFEISIKDLVERIAVLSDFKGKVIWDITKPDGQPRRMLDTTRANLEFGFQAKTDFHEGLKNTIEWYRESATSSP